MSCKSARSIGAPALIAGMILISIEALAHGYVDKPMARQQFCVRDGGYWWPSDGSAIPNAACRAAYHESGTFQFVQNIEYSANVSNYNDINAVKSVVRDGTLCAGADNAKRGMNLPHASWQRSVVTPAADGSIEVLFYASTPHNPSFWEFYLTRPGFDGASQRLTWGHLEQIGQAGNVTTVKVDGRNMYRFSVRIPPGRTGNAILFTRWQRRDPGGEGFYNCSDITIGRSAAAAWQHDKGVYIRTGTAAEAGDEVWLRVFDATGKERAFEKLAITSANRSVEVWAMELAALVNGKYGDILQIGVRGGDGSVSYGIDSAASNRVWLTSGKDTFQLDIKKPRVE